MKKAVRSLARRSALNSGNNFSSGPRLLSAEPRLSRRVTSGPETVGEVGGTKERRRRGRQKWPVSVSASGRFTEARCRCTSRPRNPWLLSMNVKLPSPPGPLVGNRRTAISISRRTPCLCTLPVAEPARTGCQPGLSPARLTYSAVTRNLPTSPQHVNFPRPTYA